MWGCLWQPKLTVHTKKKKEIHGQSICKQKKKKKKRKKESQKRKEKERASVEEEPAAIGLYMRFY